MPIRADRTELAERLYYAIGDVLDDVGAIAKLKFRQAFIERPAWRDLDPELQELFRRVAGDLTP